MHYTAPFIITGGPGSGKTTLLESMANECTQIFPEVPRQLINEQSQLVDGILPWDNLSGFADLCFTEMLRQKEACCHYPLSFLDRAIPDICAYLSWGKLEVPQHIVEEASKGYQGLVIFCKPTVEIYVQDEVRPYSFEEALDIHQRLCEIYESFGYKIFSLPLLPTEERVKLVRAVCKEYEMNQARS